MIIKDIHIVVKVIVLKLNKMIIFISIILIFTISCNVVFAASFDDNNVTLDNLNGEYVLNEFNNGNNVLETDSNENLYSSGNTIIVEPDSENPNQMINPTIQSALDSANPGDTLILKGDFAHCHFLINKTINIIGYDATLGPCPVYESEGAGSLGVFYITGDGSGSVFSGITFKNNARAVTPFNFLIRGASNITINDCTMDYPEISDYKFQGIVIEDSSNVNLSNLVIGNTIDGIKIINSSYINIKESRISNSENQAVSIIGNSSYVNIINNSFINNKNMGLNLLSANNIIVINNLIKNNGLENYVSGSGIYVNTNITKLIVKGNIFLGNGLHAILYDYRARNLNDEQGAENLTIVDNNYFEGHDSMILHHRIYVERDYGTLKYDAENDVFGDVGEGKYAEGKTYVYMQHAFIFSDTPCGFTYYSPDIPWSLEASKNDGKYDFSLKLNISQIEKGVYSLSIVDVDGNIARDFNSFNITFFLNDISTSNPQNNTYKKVLIKNGVAIADFRDDYSLFKDSGNVITAVFPGLSENVNKNPKIELNINDEDIPIYSNTTNSEDIQINSNTTLIASKLTTYPLSDAYLSAKLVDSKRKGIANQKVSFKFNGKTYTAYTNKEGIAKVKVSLSTKKTYAVTISYGGNGDYKGTKATSSIIVKTGSKKSKITSSNMKVKRNKKNTFKAKLTTSAGKALKNQKVIVKLNGKTHTLKTDSKGFVKLSFKLSKVKKYSVSVKFLGNAYYKASSKTTTIRVTK